MNLLKAGGRDHPPNEPGKDQEALTADVQEALIADIQAEIAFRRRGPKVVLRLPSRFTGDSGFRT
jgi:hypothetical protein